MEVVVEDCAAEADKVVSWSTLIGTIEKGALGCPPNDKSFSILAMAYWVITPDGQVRKIRTMYDMESFRAQLELVTCASEEKARS